MLRAAEVAVVEFGGFEFFVAAVGGIGLAAGAEGFHFRLGHRLERAGDGEVLLEDAEGIDAADGGGHGQAHGVAQAFLDGDGAAGDHFAAAAEAFHAEHGEAAAGGLGQDLLLEAAEGGVKAVQGHLHGIEGEIVPEHFQVDGGVLVAGEADEAHFALLLRLEQGFGGAAGGEDELGVVEIDDLVDLPDIEVIGLQTAEGILEHAHGHGLAPAVGADLGHEHGLVAPAFQRGAEARLAFAVVIFPGVVEEIDAGLEGLMDDLFRDFRVGRGAEMKSAQAESGDLQAGFAEGLFRDGDAGGLGLAFAFLDDLLGLDRGGGGGGYGAGAGDGGALEKGAAPEHPRQGEIGGVGGSGGGGGRGIHLASSG